MDMENINIDKSICGRLINKQYPKKHLYQSLSML